MERKLNVDVAQSTAAFVALMNEVPPKKMLYKSLFRGKGLEFDGYRQFGQDEDATNIDWKASLRSGTQLAKKYIEERDLNFMFVFDMGENMVFGSQEKLKCEIAVELVAAFSNVILNSNDRVGFILYNKNIFRVILPKNGSTQRDVFIHEITVPENYNGTAKFSDILKELYNVLASTINIVVLVSDFITVKGEDKDILEWLGNMFETMAISIKDPLDVILPDVDREIVVEDPETGRKKLVNPKVVKKVYEETSNQNRRLVKKLFTDSNIDYLEVFTNDDFVYELYAFLKKRAAIV